MNNQIPHIIHYCWFGHQPMPELLARCIKSWKHYFPDYEIKVWTEDNFDVLSIPYTAEAYHLNMYAFVSDYVRFWTLYHYGGIYFDTDVEIISPLEDIIASGPFMGFEPLAGSSQNLPYGMINPGLGIGFTKGHPYLKLVMEYYQKDHFVGWNGRYTGNVGAKAIQFLDFYHKEVLEGGIVRVNDILIYPPDYFCPLNCYTGEMHLTENTRTIHHYMASWARRMNRLQAVWQRIRFLSVRLYCMFTFYFHKNNQPL